MIHTHSSDNEDVVNTRLAETVNLDLCPSFVALENQLLPVYTA